MGGEGKVVDSLRIISDAVEDARDGMLDPQRLEYVRELLSTDVEARRYYLQINGLNHCLTSERNLPIEHVVSRKDVARLRESVRRWTRYLAHPALLGSAAVILTIVLLVAPWNEEPVADRTEIIAALERINGHVNVTTTDAQTQTVESNFNIRSGETIRTQGALSSAVLLYPDGSRLSLVGDASLTPSDDGRKSVIFHGGTMFASIATQPAGRPMLVATPQDKLQVLGTKFTLDASARQTDLSVSEGRVRLTRLRDGISIEVPSGQHVINNVRTELTLQNIPSAADEWHVDFESGLPSGWDHGEFIRDGLPTGSRGAVKATYLSDEFNDGYAIVSNAEWFRGLFSVHADSHLEIAFKMEHPQWLNIFLITRTKDSDSTDLRFANNFQYNELPFTRLQPGKWYSISIPLSEFNRLPGNTNQQLRELLPFTLIINSTAPDRGLVIDEIRITRGGPGVVELKPLP